MRRGLGAVALAAALGLSGCTGLPGAPGDAARDLRTQSDLSDAERLARVRVELAAAYFGRGQNAVALDEVKLALAAKPDMPEALNLRGLVYASMGEPRLAEESFRRALQVSPADADAAHNLAWFLCNQQRHAEADALFRQLLARPGLQEPGRTGLARGVCLARADRLAEADEVLTRVFEADPGNLAAALNLGEVMLRRGEWERARFYLRRIHAQPERASAQSLWLAVRVEHRSGQAAARDAIGLELGRRFPQSREALLFDRGRFDE